LLLVTVLVFVVVGLGDIKSQSNYAASLRMPANVKAAGKVAVNATGSMEAGEMDASAAGRDIIATTNAAVQTRRNSPRI